MVRFPEAEARLFKGKFVCKRCKSVIKASNMKVMAGKVKCRKCKGKALRIIRRK
ncbi:50S ribosomal protein L40e [Candidatus Woesearchaeota archaeon]|nr:MAG: 50S ribosomal protein L40e [Candidatus Woesearchaeota archaeon]